MKTELPLRLIAIAAAVVVAFSFTGCSGEPQSDAEEASESGYAGVEHAEGGERREGEGGEHAEGGDSEEGEESGVYIGRGDTWDVTRRGARLVLAFDPASGAFKGKVLNTTESTLCAVRVEVHLSTGAELGPTPRTDVPAGQTIGIKLSTDGEEFESWTAHPEVSGCSPT
jgi:hypothetical protein